MYQDTDATAATGSALDERAAVREAREGNHAAFEALTRVHYGAVFAIALAQLRHMEEAEDVAQEAFLRAFLLLNQLSDDTRFGAWVVRIARNLAIDWQRRGNSRRRLVPLIHLDAGIVDVPDRSRETARDQAERSQVSGVLLEHIGRLPVHLREVVLLRFMEDMAHAEVAQTLGLTQGAVASRLRSALKRLRSALEPLMREGLRSMRPSPTALSRTLAVVGACAVLSASAKSALAATAAASGGVAGIGGFSALGLALRAWGSTLEFKSLLVVLPLLLVLGSIAIWHSVRSTQPRPGLFTVFRDEPFDVDITHTGSAATGWSAFGRNAPGFVEPVWNPRDRAVGVCVYPRKSEHRFGGWINNYSEWMPYSRIGTDRYARAKFYVYAAGQTNPEDGNQIPNMQLRAQTRFAVATALEVCSHTNDSYTTQALMDQELRPSTDPAHPSVYRIDFDPVDVPYIVEHAKTEGVQIGFAAYCNYPQDNGFLGMTECVVGTYPAKALDDFTTADLVLTPSATDAGGLRMTSPGQLDFGTYLPPKEFEPPHVRVNAPPLPFYTEGNYGVTLDTTRVSPDLVGVISRDFSCGDDYAHLPRVSEDRLYKIRWHLTSTQQSNLNAMIRLRSRCIKFAWSQKLEIGGAWGTGAQTLTPNNIIAQQALPGIGCQNPDRDTSDTRGGWYTLLMHTPMSREIRSDYPPGTPLCVSMPWISAEPGGGVDAPSRRDIRLTCEIQDTVSPSVNSRLEQGNVTVDRIELKPATHLQTEQPRCPISRVLVPDSSCATPV